MVKTNVAKSTVIYPYKNRDSFLRIFSIKWQIKGVNTIDKKQHIYVPQIKAIEIKVILEKKTVLTKVSKE